MRPGSDAGSMTTAKADPRVTRVGAVLRRFKLIGISIGVVTSERRTFADEEEFIRVAAEMKHYAKTQGGSSYAIDVVKDEAIRAFVMFDRKRAVLEAHARDIALLRPAAVRITVTLQVDRARARLSRQRPDRRR